MVTQSYGPNAARLWSPGCRRIRYSVKCIPVSAPEQEFLFFARLFRQKQYVFKIEKGIPIMANPFERGGRKATGLTPQGYGSRVTEEELGIRLLSLGNP